ncbi:MAG: sterol desaturase family protein [Alphaproteobacteria bacterium]|nr:sterol desaturase family protein [Alphaproteobacteria bacterium]
MENILRLSVFLGVFVIMAVAESFWPRRPQQTRRRDRWPHNLALVILDIAVLRLVFPVSLAGFALSVNQHQWGFLPLFGLPFLANIFLTLVFLDLMIYFQHVTFHKVPILWRLHRVHHADIEFDVTTALRFHPVEILISMAIKFAAVAAIGAPPEAVLFFEIILNACAMFNHGNIALPAKWDQRLRRILVTPDMHRVHHSVAVAEINSNYGFNISLWDRLFGTYRAQPEQGHDRMKIGLEQFREKEEMRIDRMLTQPFRHARLPMVTEAGLDVSRQEVIDLLEGIVGNAGDDVAEAGFGREGVERGGLDCGMSEDEALRRSHSRTR